MDLFDYNREQQVRREGPLAARMRPRTLDEYIGQEHILAPGRLLRRAIQADQLASLIFYGPPGTGKTTLASVIANTTKSLFITLNAVLAGVADLRTITEAAQRLRGEHNRRTILFIDEVHRWNKAQQDALLPWVENGTVILIGATTENPYFTVNRALVSRSRIFQLQPLTADHLKTVIRQTLTDPERGYGKLKVDLHADALHHLADVANGDARAALNAIELAVETTPPNADGVIHIDMAVAEESIQQRAVLYDKEGDYHFDTISAFIKSLRGSDPDAALYWLAKMVYAGEDPRFMFRRMLIFAGEDVGLADPQALVVVTAAAGAFDRVGMPEGNFHLATACLYLATCPKSNSVMGFFDALALVGKEKEGEVPNHLKDASRDKEGFGHGAGYQYPHAYRDHWVAQQYLPDSLQGKVLYNPGRLGFENGLAELVRQRRELQLAALREAEGGLAPAEILSFSPPDKATDRWLARTLDGLGTAAAAIRERVFAATRPRRQDRILDLSADAGLFVWEALRQAPEGGVWALTSQAAAARALAEQAATLPDLRRPELLTGPPGELRNLLAASGNAEVRFDLMVGRNVLARAPDRAAVLHELRHLLAPGATLSLAENLPRHGTRLAPFIPKDEAGRERDTGNLACEKRQAGNPACESNSIGIHQTKRNLPHWQRDAAIYYVTFRLADSLPQSELNVWREERDAWRDAHPEPWPDDAWAEYHRLFSVRMEAWLDHGYGACVLAEPALRQEVEACLRHFDGERYRLHAFVIMPNHVHMLLEPLPGNRLDTILHGIKGVSARRCNECLGKSGTFWMDESFDHIVRSEAQLAHYLDYIRENPVKARLPAEKVTVYEMAGASAGSAVPPAFDTQAGLPALRSEQARLPVSPSFPVTPSLRVSVATAEEAVYGNVHDPLVNWDEETLAAELAATGFVAVRLERTAFTRQQRISSAELDRWFAADTPGSYASRLRAAGLAEEELRQFRTALTAALAGKTVPWPTTTVFLSARAP
jgi:putative ATPase